MLSKVLYKIPTVPDTLLAYYPILCYIWTGKPHSSNLKMDISGLDQGIQSILLAENNVLFNGEEMEDFNLVGCVLNYIKKCGDSF